jgi:hypothetical protein
VSDHTIQFEILRAVTAVLGGKAANAHRCKLSNFSEAELANGGADNVLPEKETSEEDTTDDTELLHRFQIVHQVQGASGTDAIADARFVRAFRLLNADPTLGGLVRRVKYVSREWHMESKELQQMSLVSTWECEFSTSRSDPTLAGY